MVKAQKVEGAVQRKPERSSSLAKLPWVSIVILGGLLFVAIFAPFVSRYDPNSVDLPSRLLPPAWQSGGSLKHLLGTDTMGRDLLTRIFYGSRVSLQVAVVSLAIGGTLGLVLGISAGYTGGIVDAVIMRATDSFLAVPSILLALVFALSLGPGMVTVIVAITVTLWPRFTRIIRADAKSISKRGYVLQAKVAGCSDLRIMYRHIFPNIFTTFMILLSLNLGWVVLLESSLSFVGAGIPPPTASWGQMVSEGTEYIASAWWITFFPGLAIALAVVAFNMFGDWLRDMLDPKFRQL